MTPTPAAGWPFWWRWVVATNAGWFPGIFLGLRLSQTLSESAPVLRAVTAALIAALLFGTAQALVLGGTLARPWSWLVATVIGWPAGVGLARAALDRWRFQLPTIVDAIAVAAIAGAVVGVAQSVILRRHFAGWLWWPPLSSLGWAVLFPGALPGGVLVWLARSRSARFPSGKG